ncbi:hypothetical protein AOLI_G00144440 [Acnodon oligacanthus]
MTKRQAEGGKETEGDRQLKEQKKKWVVLSPHSKKSRFDSPARQQGSFLCGVCMLSVWVSSQSKDMQSGQLDMRNI